MVEHVHDVWQAHSSVWSLALQTDPSPRATTGSTNSKLQSLVHPSWCPVSGLCGATFPPNNEEKPPHNTHWSPTTATAAKINSHICPLVIFFFISGLKRPRVAKTPVGKIQGKKRVTDTKRNTGGGNQKKVGDQWRDDGAQMTEELRYGAGSSPLTESALFPPERLIPERWEYGFSRNVTGFRSVSNRGQNSVLFATSCRLGEAWRRRASKWWTVFAVGSASELTTTLEQNTK